MSEQNTPRVWTSNIEDEELATLDVCIHATDMLLLPARRRIVEYMLRRIEAAERLYKHKDGE